jgi:hypothetical protein
MFLRIFDNEVIVGMITGRGCMTLHWGGGIGILKCSENIGPNLIIS